MTVKKSLIVTINDHPALGPLLIPYWTRDTGGDVLEAEEKVVAAGEAPLSDAEQKIIALALCYSEKKLMKTYSKEKTIAAFINSLSNPEKKKPIRAYIEKKHREIIDLIRAAAIPLYIRETATKQLYPHHRIEVCEEPAEAAYHFELTETQFRYAVTCSSGNRPVTLLKKKPFQILCSQPAILISGRELLTFKRIEAKKLLPFIEKEQVGVPASDARLYMEKILLPTMVRYPVSAAGFILNEEHRTCVPVLSVTPSVLDRPILQLHFHYGQQLFMPGQKAQRCYPRIEEADGNLAIRYYVRDAKREQECLSRLAQLGFTQIADCQFSRPDCVSEYALVDWINRHREELEPCFRLDGADKTNSYFVGDVTLKQDITDTPDWFEIRITVQIGTYAFPFTVFRKHIQQSNRYFKLPDGQIALLPEEWFEKYNNLCHFGDEQEGVLHIRKMHLGLVDALANGTDSLPSRTYVRKENLPVPPRIRATLRPYQQEGFSWMMHLLANGFGGCLADDMGLGKTLQTIALLQHLYDPSTPAVAIPASEETPFPPTLTATDRFGQLSLFADDEEALPDEEDPASPPLPREQQVQASLIVVPTSLVPNWKREIRRFSSLQICEYMGEKRGKEPWKKFGRYPIVITTYGLLRKDIDLLEHYTFNYVILDESQNIKNPDSQSYHSVIRLQCNNRLVLTGTPIENSLKDLWAQFNFINPGLLGTLADFQSRFINPVTKEGNERARRQLQQLIQPFILRRTKGQVAPELPPLTEEVVYCEMTEQQKEIYTKEKNLLRNSLLDEWHKNKLVALNGITRLRQLANHPRMILPEYPGSSGKIEQVVEAYETLVSEGHKVLIFSSFVTHLNLLAEVFDERGWPYAMLTGSTLDRENQIARFSDTEEVSAFFISLKAGGVGLNLTKADYVFILDPWWNPAAEMQAESRAHRIGQDKQVFVYRFISSNTIEEKIRILQEQKSELSDRFITENNPLEQLTDEEWESLL